MGAVVENLRSAVWRQRYALRDAGLVALVVATGFLVTTVLTQDGAGTATLVESGTADPLVAPTDVDTFAGLEGPEPALAEPALSEAGIAGSAEPSASPSDVALDAGADPATAPDPTRSPSPRPTPTPAPTPAPSSAADYPPRGLRLDVTAKAVGTLVGEITVRVRDTDGTWNGGFIAFGDGERQAFARTTPRCTTQTAPDAARPSDVTKSFRHTYSAAGYYDVVAYVRTERFCSNAPVEETSRTVRVRITGASAATPTPTPESSAEPTAEPSPAETFGPRPR